MDRKDFNPKVGDLVRIREWRDLFAEFGGDSEHINCLFGFYRGVMENVLRGLEFEITKIEYTSSGAGKYFGHNTGFSISKDMLEPVNDTAYDTEEIEKFFSEITVK